jgi:hypothetical protein
MRLAQHRLHGQKYSAHVRKDLQVGDVKAVDERISNMMIGTFRKVERRFSCFSSDLQANTGMVSQMRPWPLPSTSFSICCSPIIAQLDVVRIF